MHRTKRILKAERVKDQVTYKSRSIRTTLDFLMETLKARRPIQMFYKIKETRDTSTDNYTQQNNQHNR